MTSTREIINSLFDPRSTGFLILQYIELPKDEIQRRFSLVLKEIKRTDDYRHPNLKDVPIFRDSDIDTYVTMLYSAWFNRSFTIWHDNDEYTDLLLRSDSYKDYEFFRIFALRYAWVNKWNNNLCRIITRISIACRSKYDSMLCMMLYERFIFMMENPGEEVIKIFNHDNVEERIRYITLSRCTLKDLRTILKCRNIKGFGRKSKSEIVEVLINEVELLYNGQINIRNQN